MDRKTQQSIVTVIVLLVVLVAYLIKSREQNQPPPQAPAGPVNHLAMGNPSGATDDESNRDNFLMRKPYFDLSYNNANGTPNWVSWCLKDGDLGTAKRADQFVP